MNCAATRRSQISQVAYDSIGEKMIANICKDCPQAAAWVKNGHLDFKVGKHEM